MKGSRYVTQMKKLKETEDSVKLFQQKSSILEANLGCILWQLPPNLPRNDKRLAEFCECLDVRKNHVLEFRHPSWFTEEVYTILKENHIGFCSISTPDFPENFIVTSTIGYLRFHGKGENWYDYDYSDEELKDWIQKIQESEVKQLFVYFNNDINAKAPKNALRFKELMAKLEG